MVTHFDQLRPNIIEIMQQKIDDKSETQEKNTKVFKEGEKVWIRSYSKYNNKWITAVVKSRDGSKIYVCQTSDGNLKRLHVDQMSKNKTNEAIDDEFYDWNQFQNETTSEKLSLPTKESVASDLMKSQNDMVSGVDSIPRISRIRRPPDRYVPS